MNVKTQNHKILAYMRKGYGITPMKALSLFGCFRLASRIFDIQESGIAVKRRMVSSNGKRFCQYWI